MSTDSDLLAAAAADSGGFLDLPTSDVAVGAVLLLVFLLFFLLKRR